MRWRDLTEKYHTTLTPVWGKRVPVDVFVNPSRKEWREIKGKNYDVRALIMGNDCYAWSTFGELHNNVIAELELVDPIPVVIEGDPNGEGCHLLVTDASQNTKWLHNPEVVYALRTCAYLQKFGKYGQMEISFFDEAIVGDWRHIDDDEDEDDYEDNHEDDEDD